MAFIYVYLLFSACWLFMNTTLWIVSVADYREYRNKKRLKEARYNMLHTLSLGLLWLPALMITLVCAIKTTVKG